MKAPEINEADQYPIPADVHEQPSGEEVDAAFAEIIAGIEQTPESARSSIVAAQKRGGGHDVHKSKNVYTYPG